MSEKLFNRGLLLTTFLGLACGFLNKNIWGLSLILGLVPALLWVMQDLRRKSFSSDVLAVISLLATLLTGELFAGAVISLMLASGRVLENWAEGQADRELRSLLSRVPHSARVVTSTGEIEEIDAASIKPKDHLLIRAGEITPVDGELLGQATLDESALTGEPLPRVRNINELILSGVLNAGDAFEYVATGTAEESTYAGVIKLVKSAQARTAPGVRIVIPSCSSVSPCFNLISSGSSTTTESDVTSSESDF